MATVKTSLGVILNAIEVNGYEKAVGEYKSYTGARCAIGQGAANLLIEGSALGDALRHYDSALFDWITVLNDNTYLSVPEVAQRVRERYADRLNDEIIVTTGWG